MGGILQGAPELALGLSVQLPFEEKEMVWSWKVVRPFKEEEKPSVGKLSKAGALEEQLLRIRLAKLVVALSFASFSVEWSCNERESCWLSQLLMLAEEA